MKRRILSIFCVLALCLGLLPPITASAAAGEMTQYTHYLALGDRTCAAHEAKGSIINYKYQPTPYPAWIAQAKGYILTTSAKDGETSASLLERLPEERAQIEKSTVISVTIGNTDLLYALRDYLTETYNKGHPESTLTADQVLDKMGKADADFLNAMNTDEVGSGFVNSEIYNKTAAALEENLGKILETIHSYNPNAYLMVFNLYNPYRNMMEDGSNPDKHVKPYSAGVPTAYDKGAKAMNEIITEVCGSAIPVVDAYTAVTLYTSSPYPDFNLRANLLDNGYQGIETFYPAQGTTKFIAEAAQQLDLPDGKGWPDNAASFANGYGIVVPSTSNNQWKVGNSNASEDPYKNLWGLCLNMNNSLLSEKVSYLDLLGALLAPENIWDGYDGPFLSQDRYWKTTGGLLDFDSGSETSFEGWNIRMDKDNATLFLRDVQLEAGTNCILINQNISNLFSGGTLNIALAGSNSFCSTAASATITTYGHTGDLRFTGDGSLEITNNGSSNTNRAIVLEQGNLSIAEGAQVTVHTVPFSHEKAAVEAKTVTIEDGGALTVDLVAGSNAQPFKSDSITVEEGGSLQVTVGSSLQAELPHLDENSDLSNSTFTVDGLLVLSEWTEADLEASGVRLAGSGQVKLSDGVYSISNGSLTPVDKTTIVSGNIAVTLGTADTEHPGYTWDVDKETGAWVLTLKASTVVGNVTIEQDTGEYNDSLDPEEVEEPEKEYANPDIVIQLVTENPCTIYGQVAGALEGRYISPRYRYSYQLGTLEISGAGLAADTVSYPYGTVRLSGALDATSISAWQLHLLEDADLTLSQGVSLIVNNSSYSAILFRMYNNQEELDKYTDETVKELVMERLENTFLMEDGALYSYTGTEGTSIQIKLSYSSLLGISLGDFTAPEYEYQKFRLKLTQEDLASILQIPYDLKSAASPVFSQDTHGVEDDENAYRAVFDGYITLQSEGALELPVPDPPAGGTSGPSTGSSSGWSQIEKELENSAPGTTVTVDMNGTTEVPAEVFEAVAGKDVTLELDMGGGVKWEINGQDIPTDLDFTDLDLGVSLNTSTIPVDVINMVTGEKSTVQLSLAHDGEFGFTMTLTAPVGTQNKGLWANLYHYDTTRKQMLFETAAQVDSSGNVALKFTHASEYAIVLDESSHELPFTDTAKGAWYQGAVEYVYRNSIMTGTSATSFEPNAPLSRAMVAQILYNLEGQPTVEGESTFADASGHWAVNAIAWAQQTGVVNGYEDNTFRPNRAVSREELAQMLYNYAKVKGYDLTASGDLTAFPDGSKVSSWAEAAMAWANGNELINGHDDGTLQPGGDSTRAQAASILMNFDVNLAN